MSRLRRDLLRAGIKRHVCTRPEGLGDPGRGEPCCEGYHRDPLYSDTAVSKRADFHSFRRAFVSALAAAGANAQLGMHLASHTDPSTHMRYVMSTPAMRVIPEGALPKLLPQPANELQRAGCESPRRTTDRPENGTLAATGTDDANSRNHSENADSQSLPKLRVAVSSPVSRSIETKEPRRELQLTVAEPDGVSTFLLDDIGCPQPWPVPVA